MTAFGLAIAATLLLAAGAAAHSELISSAPAAGAVVVGSLADVAAEFSEEMDPARSSMELRGPDGARIAVGGVPAEGPPTRMVIAAVAVLGPGDYTVRWTTVTADDDGVERGTFGFTVQAAGPEPAPTAAPASSRTPEPAAGPAPAPAPAPASRATDVLIPLVVLAGILVGGGAWLLRRRR